MDIGDRVQGFLVDHALPLWGSVGVYDNGCFVERLDLSARPVDPGFTRIRVQARQLYVFSHAELVGLGTPKGLGKAAGDFLVSAFWLGAQDGWAKSARRDGTIYDATGDLYDIAFALFALAWRHRVAPDPRYVEIAHATLAHLDKRFLHAAGGFANDIEGSLPRQQNPHMHLVEALDAWFEATGDTMFVERGEAIVDLFATKFSDPTTGALGEFFTQDLAPWSSPEGNIVEPGHQFEWAWILARHGRFVGRPRPELITRLIDFAERTGFVGTQGAVIDQVGRDGNVMDASTRLWPQTEAIKAMIAKEELLGRPDRQRIEALVDLVFERFFDPAPVKGTWIDHFRPGWTPKVDNIPASSLYHVTLAFVELLRLLGHVPTLEIGKIATASEAKR